MLFCKFVYVTLNGVFFLAKILYARTFVLSPVPPAYSDDVILESQCLKTRVFKSCFLRVSSSNLSLDKYRQYQAQSNFQLVSMVLTRANAPPPVPMSMLTVALGSCVNTKAFLTSLENRPGFLDSTSCCFNAASYASLRLLFSSVSSCWFRLIVSTRS